MGWDKMCCREEQNYWEASGGRAARWRRSTKKLQGAAGSGSYEWAISPKNLPRKKIQKTAFLNSVFGNETVLFHELKDSVAQLSHSERFYRAALRACGTEFRSIELETLGTDDDSVSGYGTRLGVPGAGISSP